MAEIINLKINYAKHKLFDAFEIDSSQREQYVLDCLEKYSFANQALNEFAVCWITNCGSRKVVEKLLLAGADPGVINNDGLPLWRIGFANENCRGAERSADVLLLAQLNIDPTVENVLKINSYLNDAQKKIHLIMMNSLMHQQQYGEETVFVEHFLDEQMDQTLYTLIVQCVDLKK